jgi:hypothetical protein
MNLGFATPRPSRQAIVRARVNFWLLVGVHRGATGWDGIACGT